MIWADFVEEFNVKFFNKRAMSTEQKEFNELKKGDMTITEAVTKFNKLARLCSHLVPIEEENMRILMEKFKPELAMAVDSDSE